MGRPPGLRPVGIERSAARAWRPSRILWRFATEKANAARNGSRLRDDWARVSGSPDPTVSGAVTVIDLEPISCEVDGAHGANPGTGFLPPGARRNELGCAARAGP
jgi:hypothetical protein